MAIHSSFHHTSTILHDVCTEQNSTSELNAYNLECAMARPASSEEAAVRPNRFHKHDNVLT
jgi:hypothetical protein